MDIVRGIAEAIGMLLIVAVVIGLVAALFMIIFSIATGVDERLQE